MQRPFNTQKNTFLFPRHNFALCGHEVAENMRFQQIVYTGGKYNSGSQGRAGQMSPEIM